MKYLVLLSSLLLPAVAQAAVVDFAPESGRFTDLGIDGRFGTVATGSWREDGFDVGFRYNNLFEGLGTVVEQFNAGPLLTDSDCCFGDFTNLTFSRPDAQSFSLREIDFGSTISSFYGEVSFTPYAADGSLDSIRSVSQQVDVAPANVVLRGMKSDGTKVSALVNSYFNSNGFGGVGGPNDSFVNAAPFVLGGDLARTLSNLTFLDVTIGGPYSLGINQDVFLEEILRTSLTITDGLDELFYRGFDQCFLSGQSVSNCSFENFGQFRFSYTSDVLGNYGSNVSFESFTFDNDSSIAPVPLPATAPLLVAALGFLGWRSRRVARLAAAG